jgi:hypothetical protein
MLLIAAPKPSATRPRATAKTATGTIPGFFAQFKPSR